MLWIINHISVYISKNIVISVNIEIYAYVFFLLVYTLISILFGALRSEILDVPFHGFGRIGTYAFFFLIVVVSDMRIDLEKIIKLPLIILAFCTIAIFIIKEAVPEFGLAMIAFGNMYGIFTFAPRSYGVIDFWSVYFHTSTMMILSVAIFTKQAFYSNKKFMGKIFLGLTLFALLLSGSRNNIIFGILSIYIVLVIYAKRKVPILIVGLFIAVAGTVVLFQTLAEMFNPDDVSNSVKLQHIRDYNLEFSNPLILIFGTGLGSTFFSTAWGTTVSLTELTYFDLLRNYGVLGIWFILGLLLYPAYYVIKKRGPIGYASAVGYLTYLAASFSNPLFFSSSGVILVSCLMSPYTDEGKTSLSVVGNMKKIFPIENKGV
jgi:hypothetical protein